MLGRPLLDEQLLNQEERNQSIELEVFENDQTGYIPPAINHDAAPEAEALVENPAVENPAIAVDEVELANINMLKNSINNLNPTDLARELANGLAFNSITPQGKKQVLDHYIEVHKIEYYTLVGHSAFGYLGEFFYLFWDLKSRLTTTAKLTHEPVPNPEDPESESILFAASKRNIIGNAIATPFITLANVTYNPFADAKDYFKMRMLNPETALSHVIYKHPFLATMFLTYAFGGSYVEVDGLKDEEWAKKAGPAINILYAALVYSGIAYYAAFQFNDTIQGFAKWKASKSLLLEAITCGNGLNSEERIINLFSAAHEFIAFSERVFRMSYGGFRAQGYELGSAIGLGTTPVAIATRCLPTRKMYKYEANGLTAEEFATATAQYNAAYMLSPKWNQAKLFFSAPIFLTLPGAYFAYQYGADSKLEGDNYKNYILGTMAAVVTSLTTDYVLQFSIPARRKAIIDLALDTKAVQAILDNPTLSIPNKKSYALSFVANFLDQSSRVGAIFFMLNRLWPDTFDNDNSAGEARVFAALCVDAFLSSSSFKYQQEKGQEAYSTLVPTLFATKPVIAQAAVAPLALPEDAEDLMLPEPATRRSCAIM